MNKWKETSGFQKKYLNYILGLLLIALLLSSVGVFVYMRKNISEVMIEKYAFVHESMEKNLDALYAKSDEVTAECILNDEIQKSLNVAPVESIEKSRISKYFAYLDLSGIEEYCYVDNKDNIYTRSYSKISYEEFEKSNLEKQLGDSYASTQWFWAEDTLFQKGEKALFIGRYVHSMEYAHEPGILLLKMNERFLKSILDKRQNDAVLIGIMDQNGSICLEEGTDAIVLTKADKKKIVEAAQAGKKEFKRSYGIVNVSLHEKSGMILYSIIPNQMLNEGISEVIIVLIAIYLLVMLLAIILSIYFSERFTRPIQEISTAMTGFDGNDFSKTIHLQTNTELDQIGESYNLMLENIQKLLEEIKQQEKELHRSEVNLLISQINPHFLYNTLDTIYMLARINKEETTMKMIQALSKYLRLCLSKGNDIVTVEDELENVKSYMQIQQIRNENLFHYEIESQVDEKKTWILKLILQPLVENAIKYGFVDIYEGGLVSIRIYHEENGIYIKVKNNGKPMEEETKERINRLNQCTISEVKEYCPDKKHGYGVSNMIIRLRLKYGEGVKFYYETGENETECIIYIPDDGKENKEL